MQGQEKHVATFAARKANDSQIPQSEAIRDFVEYSAPRVTLEVANLAPGPGISAESKSLTLSPLSGVERS